MVFKAKGIKKINSHEGQLTVYVTLKCEVDVCPAELLSFFW